MKHAKWTRSKFGYKTHKPLSDYYLNNWESSKKMWSKCFRKTIPTLGDNTKNRIKDFLGFQTQQKVSFMLLDCKVCIQL